MAAELPSSADPQMPPDARARLERLLAAARAIADATSDFGRAARARLVASTGLSPEGVDAALERSLEIAPTEAELGALAASVSLSSRASPARAHVLLSSTVFVAAHRAIALALAAAPDVYVRPSRREPEMARLLAEAAPGLFRLVDALAPVPSEPVFAYGHRATLDALRRDLPRGVVLHAHGPGFGLVVCDGAILDATGGHADLARHLARDVALFDQRGCLSPRAVLCQGSRAQALRLAGATAAALGAIDREIPRGALAPDENADIRRFCDVFAYAGDLLDAGPGFVGVSELDAPFDLAPVGRNLVIAPLADAARTLRRYVPHVTTYAVCASAELVQRVESELPRARRAAPGALQTPPFDGPVDRRGSTAGERL